jgi:integrase
MSVMRITRVLNQQPHRNMNFELNDPTGSSLPSNGDSAPTTDSHRVMLDRHDETCINRAPASRPQPNANVKARQPTAASFATVRHRLNTAALRRTPSTTSTDRSVDSSSPPFKLSASSAGPAQSLRSPSLHDIVDVGYSADEITSTGYKAIMSAITSFGLLVDHRNQMPVQDITAPTAYSFIEQRLACGLSWWAVSQHLVVLSSVVRRGKQRGLLPVNLPCVFDLYGQRMLKRTLLSAMPHPFRAADLQRLFSSDLYLNGHTDPLDPQAGRFWVPLVALFTGARTGELACAQVSDVELHKGAWVLRVPSSRCSARTTSAGDSRLVPLHPELVRCGFIRYVAERKLAGETTLLPMNAEGTANAQPLPPVNRWFARYAQGIGLQPELQTLHSLRSTFLLACTLSGMGERTCAELAGLTPRARVPREEAGPELTPERLASFSFYWIPQLRFDGLELSHLHVHDPMAGVEEALPISAVAYRRYWLDGGEVSRHRAEH